MPQIITRSNKPPLPEGNYAAVIRGVRPYMPPWGVPSSEVWFEICETPHAGELIKGSVSNSLDERSKLSGWLRGLGIIIPPPDPNKEFAFDIESLVNKPCVVQVKHKPSKRTGQVYANADQVYAFNNYQPTGQVVAPTNRPLPVDQGPINQGGGAQQPAFQRQPFPVAQAPAGFPPAPQAAAPLAPPPAPAAGGFPFPPAAPAPLAPPPAAPPVQSGPPRPPFAGAVKFE